MKIKNLFLLYSPLINGVQSYSHLIKGVTTKFPLNKGGLRGLFLSTAYCLLLTVFLCGCGGGGGAPGSSGSKDTGILIQSVLLSVDSNDIDAYSNPVGCGTAPNFTPESPLTDALVTMNITAIASNPDPTFVSPFPANIESCFVSYSSAVTGAPIIESTTIYPSCSFSEGGSCTLDLLNIARKNQWWNDVVGNLPVEYPTRYTVVYSCKYQNSFQKEGQLGGHIDIDLADWLSCGG